MKAAIILLATWLLGITICFGLLLHEFVLVKEQAMVSQSVSAKAMEQTDKWANEYYYHIQFYHVKR